MAAGDDPHAEACRAAVAGASWVQELGRLPAARARELLRLRVTATTAGLDLHAPDFASLETAEGAVDYYAVGGAEFNCQLVLDTRGHLVFYWSLPADLPVQPVQGDGFNP